MGSMETSEPWLLENGTIKRLTKDSRNGHGHSRTAHNMSSSSLRKKSDMPLLSKLPFSCLRNFLASLHEVIFGTKLSILFLAVPMAFAAHYFRYSRPCIFCMSLLGLIPLAERVSFLTEQISFYKRPEVLSTFGRTGSSLSTLGRGKVVYVSTSPIHRNGIGTHNPWKTALGVYLLTYFSRQISFYTGATVGGLLNATCGNATEVIIAILELIQNKVDVVKYSLLGSILSNLLLVLGSSILCGGLANISRDQLFDRKQSDVNISLLLLALLCNILPLICKHAAAHDQGPSADVLHTAKATLNLSRASCIIMLLAYFAYLAFQLWTHNHIFEQQEEGVEDNMESSNDECAVIGLWGAIFWLTGMTVVVALLSEYLVDTIDEASTSWGMPLSFTSIVLLPIVGNAAEHAGAIIFAIKNKLDITLGVALGSATQIAVFVVPLSVIVAWTIGVDMDLDFSLLETGSLSLAILVTAFTLQGPNNSLLASTGAVS